MRNSVEEYFLNWINCKQPAITHQTLLTLCRLYLRAFTSVIYIRDVNIPGTIADYCAPIIGLGVCGSFSSLQSVD